MHQTIGIGEQPVESQARSKHLRGRKRKQQCENEFSQELKNPDLIHVQETENHFADKQK